MLREGRGQFKLPYQYHLTETTRILSSLFRGNVGSNAKPKNMRHWSRTRTFSGWLVSHWFYL